MIGEVDLTTLLTREAAGFHGKFLLDDEVLAEAGVTGVFADQPGLAAGVREALRHEAASRTSR